MHTQQQQRQVFSPHAPGSRKSKALKQDMLIQENSRSMNYSAQTKPLMIDEAIQEDIPKHEELVQTGEPRIDVTPPRS